MPSIEKRVGKKGVTWRVQVTVGGIRRTKSFRRKTDAVEWAIATENAMRDGHAVPDRKERQRTVADLLDRYRKEILPRYGAYEQQQRGSRLAWWVEQLGETRLVALTAAAIGSKLRLLEEGHGPRAAMRGPASAGTQNRYLTTLHHVLAAAVKDWGWLRENPAARVRPRKEPRGRVRYLSEDERGRLLAACECSENPRLYPLVVLALGTGGREGELLDLRWPDVDLVRAQAVVDGKNGERRALVLNPQCLAVLRDRGQVRQINNLLAFATGAGRATFPRKAWEAALRRAKLEDFRFHDLRHTFASYLAMSGASLPELAAALGHKTLAMVQRYAHLSPAHTAGVVKRMTEKFLS